MLEEIADLFLGSVDFSRMKLLFPNFPFVKTVLFPIKNFPAVFQNQI